MFALMVQDMSETVRQWCFHLLRQVGLALSCTVLVQNVVLHLSNNNDADTLLNTSVIRLHQRFRAQCLDSSFSFCLFLQGTSIYLLLSSVLFDETQWEKPHAFYPAHFLDKHGKFVKRDAFMPFSAGL